MRKVLSVLLAFCMLATAICITVAAESPTYTVEASEYAGIEMDASTATDAPLTSDGKTVAEDEIVSATLRFFLGITCEGKVKKYTVTLDGQVNAAAIQANYNTVTDKTDLFLQLNQGHYGEILVKGIDESGHTYDVIRLTDLTVTAPVHSIPDIDDVDENPCWTLNADDLCADVVSKAVTVENLTTYVTCSVTQTGDPYMRYINGPKTKIGRYLLIKYNNHTVIPRMQVYIAQEGGITSDGNMIEFEIAADNSGWTYVIVDLAQNPFYDNETMSVCHLRFDPLEARHFGDGSYRFTGNETIDIAYIKGFTTKAGARGYLEAHELRPVTKTGTLVESQLNSVDGTFTYTDKNGTVHPVTANGDGTYSYTFETNDVREPVLPVPVLALDGSRLIGNSGHACELDYDSKTGVATYTATGPDPYFMLTSETATYARYMAVRYRTAVDDSMEFFLSSTDAGPAAGQSFQRKLNPDGEWHTEVIDLSQVGVSGIDTQTYALNFIRMDFLCGAESGAVEVEYVAFFDDGEAPDYYTHTYKTFTVTFVSGNTVVERVCFEPGATSVPEPAVPEKEGYTGNWTPYTVADKDFTVKAIYILNDIETEPGSVTDETQPDEAQQSETQPDETQPAETEPDVTLPDETDPDRTADTDSPENTGSAVADEVNAADETASGDNVSDSGCGSILCACVAVIGMLMLAVPVCLKKKSAP